MSAFIIMLDEYLEVFDTQWPISGKGDDLDEVRQQRQHNGHPETVPRSTFRAELIEAKSLIHNQTGRVDRGGIYRVHANEALVQ